MAYAFRAKTRLCPVLENVYIQNPRVPTGYVCNCPPVIVPPVPPVPTPPIGIFGTINFTNVTNTTVDISWTFTQTSGDPVTYYNVFYTPAGGSLQTFVSTGTSCSLLGLTPNTVYTVSIQAANAAGNGIQSSPATFTTTFSISWIPANSVPFGTLSVGAWATSVSYGNSLWVAVGHMPPGNQGGIYTSTDATTWTLVTGAGAPPSNWIINDIAFNGSLWMATGVNPSGIGFDVYTSVDGTNWVGKSLVFGTGGGLSIYYGSGTWVVGGLGGTMFYSLDDGTTWTAVISTTMTPVLNGNQVNLIRYANGQWVALGQTPSTPTSTPIWTSPDGIHWSPSGPSPLSTFVYPNGVVYSNGTWVLVASGILNTTQLATSTDGITWTLYTGVFPIAFVGSSISYFNNVWIVVGYNGGSGANSYSLTYSGGTFTAIASPTLPALLFGNGGNGYRVEYSNGIFVAVGATASGTTIYHT